MGLGAAYRQFGRRKRMIENISKVKDPERHSLDVRSFGAFRLL